MVCDPTCFQNLQEIDWSYGKVRITTTSAAERLCTTLQHFPGMPRR